MADRGVFLPPVVVLGPPRSGALPSHQILPDEPEFASPTDEPGIICGERIHPSGIGWPIAAWRRPKLAEVCQRTIPRKTADILAKVVIQLTTDREREQALGYPVKISVRHLDRKYLSKHYAGKSETHLQEHPDVRN